MPTNEASGHVDPVETQATAESAAESSAPSQAELTGAELVTDLMRRQDAAIAQIDELNARIEAAIDEITSLRKQEEAELAAQLAAENQDSLYFEGAAAAVEDGAVETVEHRRAA